MRMISSAAVALTTVSLATVALATVALALSACSGSENAPPSASVQADVQTLQEILGNDPARAVLHDVDQAIEAERPVMAAELIERAAAPAIGRHIEAFEGARITTMEGRRFRTRAIRIHRARRAAVERYGRALSRGIGTEDDELLEALDAYGDAERDILALHDDLAEIRPLSPDALQRLTEDRESTLGGQPPHRRGETATDDDAEPVRPAGEPDDSLGEPTDPLPEE